MTAMAWPLWMLALFFATGTPQDDMKKPPPPAKRYSEFVKECKDDIHVSCIRQGTGWLAHNRMPLTQRRSILFRVANAYLSLRRDNKASAAIQEAIKLAPCSPAPEDAPQRSKALYRLQQTAMFKADKMPPIITHIPPSSQQFRSKGLLVARATDDMQVKGLTLHYRLDSKGSFAQQPFERGKGEQFTTKVSTKVLSSLKRFEYFIEASDCAGHKSTNQANASNPTKIVFEGRGSSGRAIGAGLLIAVGAGLLVGSSLALVSASTEGERLNNIKDPTEKAALQSRVSLFQGLGWSGIALSGVAIAIGAYLLVPRKKTPPPGSAGAVTGQTTLLSRDL